jgi:hypothetical protein
VTKFIMVLQMASVALQKVLDFSQS